MRYVASVLAVVLLGVFVVGIITPALVPRQPVEVTWRGRVGYTRLMYHKVTGEEKLIERQRVIFAGGETLYVTQDTYDAMQAGDKLTAEAFARMKRESAQLRKDYYDLIDQYHDEKLARPPKLHR